jgi:multiple sugar transport system permease protein
MSTVEVGTSARQPTHRAPAGLSAAAIEARARARRARSKAIWFWAERLTLLAVGVIVMFPIVWMVMTAFKPVSAVYVFTAWFEPTLNSFREIFNPRWRIAEKLTNSIVIAVATVAISTPIAVAASYAFSRLEFPFRRAMFQWILLTQFIPGVTIILPFYVMFRQIGLLDTRLALIIVDLAIVLPYAIWTIKGFIDAIPLETEEAAIIDGASRLRVLWDIVVPMAAPGIITAAIFSFIVAWNEFLFAFLLTRQDAVPLSVGIVGFILERGPLWELIAATGIIITVPMFFFALIIQRHFTKGMTVGAVR